MRLRVVPRTLRAQIALLVLGVLVLAQALSLWFFVDERSLAVQAAIGAEAAARAANVAQLIEGAPQELHAQIIRAATSPLVRFDLAEAPTVPHGAHSSIALSTGYFAASCIRLSITLSTRYFETLFICLSVAL